MEYADACEDDIHVCRIESKKKPVSDTGFKAVTQRGLFVEGDEAAFAVFEFVEDVGGLCVGIDEYEDGEVFEAEFHRGIVEAHFDEGDRFMLDDSGIFFFGFDGDSLFGLDDFIRSGFFFFGKFDDGDVEHASGGIDVNRLVRAEFPFVAMNLAFEFIEREINRFVHVFAAFFAFDGNAFVRKVKLRNVAQFFDGKRDLSVEVIADVFADHTADLFVSVISECVRGIHVTEADIDLHRKLLYLGDL